MTPESQPAQGDTLAAVVAELREESKYANPYLPDKFKAWADRLEKLAAVPVGVTDAAQALVNGDCHLIWDHGTQRIVVELPLFNRLQAALAQPSGAGK